MTISTHHGAQPERRSRRRGRALYLRFHSPMPGEVVNFSELGMAVETLIDLPPGYELTFRLRRNGGYLELRGWIRWSRPVRTISTSQGRELRVFHSGVEFDQATVARLRNGSEVLAGSEGEANGAAHEGVVGLQSPGK